MVFLCLLSTFSTILSFRYPKERGWPRTPLSSYRRCAEQQICCRLRLHYPSPGCHANHRHYLSPPTQLVHLSPTKTRDCLDLNPTLPQTALTFSWRGCGPRLNNFLLLNSNRGLKHTAPSPSFSSACSLTPAPFCLKSRPQESVLGPSLSPLPLRSHIP